MPSPSASKSFDVTHRSVLAIAVPMTLAYLSTPLLGIVDTAVIGQLGVAALIGGIAIGGIIFDLVFAMFNFLRSGTTGLTAQAYGANDQAEVKATFLRAMLIAVSAGTAIVLLQSPLLSLSLAFMGGSAEVQEATTRYFEIRINSAPFLLANYAVLGWFLGLGRATTGLALQLFLNGLNIALSILFVIGFGWSIEGVALATVLSEILALLFGIGLVLRATKNTQWPGLAVVFDKHLLMRMLNLNRDIMIRSLALVFAFMFFTARSADQGDAILAANAILQKFFIVGGHFLDGLATAAEQLVGRAIGAGRRRPFDRAVFITLIWSFALSGGLAVFYIAAGPLLIDLMTVSQDVREIARSYVLWAALTPLFAVLAFQMDGVFIGATWSKDMRNMMLLSLMIFIAAYYLLFPLWQNHGLWLALELFLSLRGISLAFICRHRADQTFGKSQPSRLFS